MLTTSTELAALEQALAAANTPTIPAGTATEISLIDWSAAHMGDAANVEAFDAWLAGVPMTWLPIEAA